MDVFLECQKINALLFENSEITARNELINLLDYHEKQQLPYTPLLNHLIRRTGLFPYLKPESSHWEDKFIYEAFKVDIGDSIATLHREQSSLLKRLINDESVAVSAPTSFGKSFVVDAFISIKKPNNVVIIVPTIALTDETRRRLYKKFADQYKIITTTDVELSEKNIFIFPQERAMSYIDKIDEIDILIIDEFYKASAQYDKERSPALLKAIIKFSAKAKQRYFLAPNISALGENVFTKGMVFDDKLNFNTVFLKKYDLYKDINKDETLKGEALLKILNGTETKTLIYAASYPQIEKVAILLIENLPILKKQLLQRFFTWLTVNYDINWKLASLIKRGIGIHNGQLHRSISQIQVKLFEEREGIDAIISTSSIIEGVNTSAENVVIWRNKRSGGNSNLDIFTYKNIIGRGGRMFKYFVGNIYLLESPPNETTTQLDLPFPDGILGDIDEVLYKDSLNSEQIGKIISFKQEMYDILGKEIYDEILKGNKFQTSDSEFLKAVAVDMKNKPAEWNGLSYLNSSDPGLWDRLLYKITYLLPGGWGDGPYGESHRKIIACVKTLSGNWEKSIPELLDELDEEDIDIEQFFKLERTASYKLSALVHDINILQSAIINNGVDISSFVSKLSHAFLPSVVYQLEEYGLPRMISRKIQRLGLINFEQEGLSIHLAINKFHEIGKETLIFHDIFDSFDRYIIEYFYDGITVSQKKLKL